MRNMGSEENRKTVFLIQKNDLTFHIFLSHILFFLFLFVIFMTTSYLPSVNGEDEESSSVEVYPGELIQSAITNASEGETILVHSGVYHESITINKSITIIGEDASIQGGKVAILVNASQVKISGFRISATDNGIHLTSAEDVVMEGITVSDVRQSVLSTGIRTDGCTSVSLMNVHIINCSYGVYFRDSFDLRILNSNISGNKRAGAFFSDCSQVEMKDSILWYNDIGLRILSSEFSAINVSMKWNQRYGSFPEKSEGNYSSCIFQKNDYALHVRDSKIRISESEFLHNSHNFDTDDLSSIETVNCTFEGGESISTNGGVPKVVYVAVVIVVFLILRFILPTSKWEYILEKFLMMAALSSILFIIIIFYFLITEGIHTFEFVSVKEFLFGKTWNPSFQRDPQYGIAALVVSTFLVTAGAVLIAVPIGVSASIYLSEFAPSRVREIIKPAIELLVGIPSVVYGFFALIILATWLQDWLNTTTRLNALLGSIMLAVMMLPIIISLSEDALRSVPMELKEASLALGATQWETARSVLVPAALSGIIGAIILGIARAVGETMTVLMATGNSPAFTFNMLQSVRTMTATIAIEMGEVAIPSRHYYALFGIGIVLFIITFIINLVADIILSKYKERYV